MKLGLFLKNLGHPIAYYPSLVKVVGGVLPCLFLCQMYYWQGKQKDPDGWIFKSQAEIQEETGMGRREQESARKDLKARGLIQERFAGCPRRLEYLLIDDALEARWQEYLQGVPTAIAEVPPAWKRKKSSGDDPKTEQSILAETANMDRQKTGLHNGAIEHYVQADPANISLYIPETTPENTNREYFSPLTPQGAEEKKEEGSAALLEEEKPPATAEVKQPESSRFVDREKQDLAQEPKILPETKVPPRQVEVIPATTAIEPFGNQRSGLAIAKERAAASVIPPGPWMVSGEIDDNFVNWIAKKFVARHGGDIFDAETNVLLSFENNPAKIPHYWRGYTREMGYRAANIAVQENAGIQSPQLQEHKQFVTQHQRALTNPSPDANHKEAQDLMNLASREFDPSHHPLDAADSPVALPAEPDWDAIADRDSHVEQEYLSSGAYPPQQAVADAPRDAYGQTESGDAYRPYKPAQVESVPPPKDLLKRVNGLAEAREMKPVGDRVGRRNVRAPQKSPIDLLNDMLANPICRRDRSVQIRAESYASPLTEQKEGKVCEKEYELYRDENGLIFKVEEIQF